MSIPRPSPAELRRRVIARCNSKTGSAWRDLRNMVSTAQREELRAILADMIETGALYVARAFCSGGLDKLFTSAAQVDAFLASEAERREAVRERRRERQRLRYQQKKGGKVRAKPTPTPITFAKPPAKPKVKRWDDSTPVINNVEPVVLPTCRDFKHTFRPPQDWQGGHVNPTECRPWARVVAP